MDVVSEPMAGSTSRSILKKYSAFLSVRVFLLDQSKKKFPGEEEDEQRSREKKTQHVLNKITSVGALSGRENFLGALNPGHTWARCCGDTAALRIIFRLF